jgi:acyl-CoA thioester hydrolase
MQEAAFDASADVGYDEEEYIKLGSYWLIRETQISLNFPLRSNDLVDVITWVDDFRSVRSRRIYEFRLVPKNELAGNAVSDWVYLDRNTGHPQKIPDEIAAAFIKDGEEINSKPRPRFPKINVPPNKAYLICREVEWRDIDSAQHVNNAIYLAYFEDCGIQVAKEYGWGMKRMQDMNIGVVARKHHILYQQPAILGDKLKIATWLTSIQKSTVKRHYVLIRPRDNEILGQSYSVYELIDLDTEKPTSFPASFRQDFKPNTKCELGVMDGSK